MRVITIQRIDNKFYKLICQLTLDDLAGLDLDDKTLDKFKKTKFRLENIMSHQGFWFRLCYETEWDGKREVLKEEHKYVRETKATSNRGQRSAADRHSRC